MPRALIGRKTLNEFREFLVGWTLREIDDEFSAANVIRSTPTVTVTGERRSRVEEYYGSLNLTDPNDARRLLEVFENILVQAYQARDESANDLVHWLQKDGYEYENQRLRARGRDVAPHLAAMVTAMDAQRLHDELRRLEDSVESDPALAIGTAKELVESVCRTILEVMQQPAARNSDLGELVKSTTKCLKLAPSDIPEAAKGADLVKKTLHNLAAIVGNVAELRNLYGTGHGKSGKAKGLDPRHARLVAGAASTLATFLWDTFERRGK
uniref:Abortive infection protein-like C-terminal domain-containing protein n=1 Tax=mine drainage metagenome TaxID=410659 RepID=E6Q7N4_9ZZZZ